MVNETSVINRTLDKVNRTIICRMSKIVNGSFLPARVATEDCVVAAESATDDMTTAESATDDMTTSERATDGMTAAKRATDGMTAAKRATDDMTATERATDGMTATERATDGMTAAERATDSMTAAERGADGMAAAAVDPAQVPSGDMLLLPVAAVQDATSATPHIAIRTVRRTFNDKAQEFFATLKQHLASGRYCDFTIKTNDGEVRCHKMVLLASSSYFRNIINENTNSYYEPDIKKATLHKILAWLYHNDVTIEETCIEEMIKVGNKWHLVDLLKICSKFLSDFINVNNVCLFYMLKLKLQINAHISS